MEEDRDHASLSQVLPLSSLEDSRPKIKGVSRDLAYTLDSSSCNFIELSAEAAVFIPSIQGLLFHKEELDFEVGKVACSGKLFAARSEKQMKEMTGGTAGIDIFNAKEKLQAELGASSAGNNIEHRTPSTA